MLLWIIQISIIFIILIIIVHHLFIFLQNNFSIPIIKDFVDIDEKYQNMLNTIQEKDVSLINDLPITNDSQRQQTEQEEQIDMKNELKKFVKFEL
jgi:hypothetical protein